MVQNFAEEMEMTVNIAQYIDHTLLNPSATSMQIGRLCEEAVEHGFFAVCVNPYYVRQCVKALSSSKVAVATVVGFPLGANLTDIKIAEAQRAVSEGAEELDMVINVGALKDKHLDLITEEIKSIVRAGRGALVKVIIETDLLSVDEKVAAVKACISGGASIVKTSTGFVKDGVGATIEDIRLIKQTLDEAGAQLGIKASGGIRDLEKAQALIEAGATRLGTSSSVAIVQGSKAASAAY